MVNVERQRVSQPFEGVGHQGRSLPSGDIHFDRGLVRFIGLLAGLPTTVNASIVSPLRRRCLGTRGTRPTMNLRRPRSEVVQRIPPNAVRFANTYRT
jgi:hypothetical protein